MDKQQAAREAFRQAVYDFIESPEPEGHHPILNAFEKGWKAALLACSKPAGGGWLPIESYKRGEVMFYQPRVDNGRGRMKLNARIVIDNRKPYPRKTTHWMPLPTTPSTPDSGGVK